MAILNSGPQFCTSGTGSGWSSPQYISGTSNYAGYGPLGGSGGTTTPLKGTGFGFSIPSTATIVGVQLSFYRVESSGTKTSSVTLVYNGATLGSSLGPGSAWSTGPVQETWGSSATMWGLTSTTLTPAIVNDTTFGFQMVAQGGAYALPQANGYQMTIYYTAPSGPTVWSVILFNF